MDEMIGFIGFLVIAIIAVGAWFGGSAVKEAEIRKEIEQYNSIRIDGVYYYPEEVSNVI